MRAYRPKSSRLSARVIKLIVVSEKAALTTFPLKRIPAFLNNFFEDWESLTLCPLTCLTPPTFYTPLAINLKLEILLIKNSG
jgi:hypothetical protein